MTSEPGLYMQTYLLYGSPKKGGFTVASMDSQLTHGINETCALSIEDLMARMKKAIEAGIHEEDHPALKHSMYDAATAYHDKENDEFNQDPEDPPEE